MAEYIEREAAINAVRHAWTKDLEPTQFIDDIPAADVVDVEKALEWLQGYTFADTKQVYTNGAVLVTLFRVKQAFSDKAYSGQMEG